MTPQNNEQIYSTKNAKVGYTVYLHIKITDRGGRLYYFTKDIIDGVPLPDGYEVDYGEYTGMPYLRKIK